MRRGWAGCGAKRGPVPFVSVRLRSSPFVSARPRSAPLGHGEAGGGPRRAPRGRFLLREPGGQVRALLLQPALLGECGGTAAPHPRRTPAHWGCPHPCAPQGHRHPRHPCDPPSVRFQRDPPALGTVSIPEPFWDPSGSSLRSHPQPLRLSPSLNPFAILLGSPISGTPPALGIVSIPEPHWDPPSPGTPSPLSTPGSIWDSAFPGSPNPPPSPGPHREPLDFGAVPTPGPHWVPPFQNLQKGVPHFPKVFGVLWIPTPSLGPSLPLPPHR